MAAVTTLSILQRLLVPEGQSTTFFETVARAVELLFNPRKQS
jgi:hypothetical protein